MCFQVIYSNPVFCAVFYQFGTHIDHQEREIRRIFDPRRRRVHEIFQPEMLFRLPKVEFDLESQAVIIHQLFPTQLFVAAKQNDVSYFLRFHVRLDDDYRIERRSKLRVQKKPLIILRADVALRLTLF